MMQVDYQKFPVAEGENSRQKGISINSGLKFDFTSAIQKMDQLIKTYSTEKLPKEQFRTKFLSSDDTEYMERIEKLKQDL